MMMGASLRFFEVELEVEGTGFMLEGTGLMLEGVSFKLEEVSFKREGTPFEPEEVSFEVCGAGLKLEEAGSTIRFFGEVDSATVSAARRRFFCFFSLVSYNPIIASASYQHP